MQLINIIQNLAAQGYQFFPYRDAFVWRQNDD